MNTFVEDLGRFQTASQKLLATIADAHRVSPTMNSVLIIGDPGSGRRELALEIQEKSGRSQNRIIRWTAQSLGDSMPSTGETVLVENVDGLSRDQQHWLFDEISKTSRRVRWIATGCRDLVMRTRSEKFLLSLYQILSTHVLTMPTLAERAEDIIALAHFQVGNWNMITGQNKALSLEACRELGHRNYSRNVTELFELVERAYAKSLGNVIAISDFGLTESVPAQISQVGLTLSEMERRLILQTLELTQQNRTRAAEILGISIRTLRNKLHEYREMGVAV